MKRNLFTTIAALVVFAGCSNGFISCADKNETTNNTTTNFEDVTDYTDSTTATPSGVVADDLYENFAADATVYISFDGQTVTKTVEGSVSADDISVKNTENSAEDEAAKGVEIQYKGKSKIKYVLSGSYTGTVFIKNKSADAAVVLNNVSITSDNGAGPALRFSSEKRTFIVVPSGTSNTITDTRELNQTSTMYDDKKGSVYSKGTLIFTGETSTTTGGSLSITNTGYKHAVYTKDYIRIADITLNVTVKGINGRDCIRALNAVIVDAGNITLVGNGTITDDESAGIRVDGEDADDDDMTVEYTAGAGFIIINGGTINSTTVAKGITAHWKSAKSVIGNSSYTETANNSLLCKTLLKGTTATTPDPYVEINGGTINITTTGTPYEGKTDDDPSCSPEGIEAKGNLTINAGTITLNCTDDALNAGGNITINGGAIYAYSSMNDAMDANGSNGITINGGVIVAAGTNMPECAFDADFNPLTINGGTLIGLGTSNYTAPSNGKQSTVVLSSSNCGAAGTTFAIVDSKNNPVFVYTLPAKTGDVVILSSPQIAMGTTYTLKTGVTVKSGTGTRFHNMYTTMPTISGGTASSVSIATSSSEPVYKDSSVGQGGFGGGPGGFGGPGGRFADGEFPEGMTPPEGMGQPPEGFNGQRPEGMREPPEGFDQNFKGGRGGGKRQ